MKVWWPGPLSNLLRGPVMGAMFVPPKDVNIEPGIDRAKLAAAVKSAKSFPLSIWADQIRYIIGHDSLKKGELTGTKVVYVRSTRDTDTVRPEARDHWLRAAGKVLPVNVDSTHVGFNERPATWNVAFRAIFEKLSLTPTK